MNFGDEAFGEAKSHGIARNGLENGFDEDFFSGLREMVTTPRLDLVPNFLSKKSEQITFPSSSERGKPQVPLTTSRDRNTQASGYYFLIGFIYLLPEANIRFPKVDQLPGGNGVKV